MSPSLKEGDFIISISKHFVRLKIGDKIVFNHSEYGFLIKEICKKTDNGFYVQGTSSLSTDSKSIGLVTYEMIEGKLVFTIER